MLPKNKIFLWKRKTVAFLAKSWHLWHLTKITVSVFLWLSTVPRHHLSYDDWLENKSEDYQNCSVLYCVPQLYTVISTRIWTVLTAVLGLVKFRFTKGFLCVFFIYRPVFLICVFGVFSPVCFKLSVPVQVIAWKDSSPKWPVICCAGRKTLLTHSLTHIVLDRYIYLFVCLSVYLVFSWSYLLDYLI